MARKISIEKYSLLHMREFKVNKLNLKSNLWEQIQGFADMDSKNFNSKQINIIS